MGLVKRDSKSKTAFLTTLASILITTHGALAEGGTSNTLPPISFGMSTTQSGSALTTQSAAGTRTKLRYRWLISKESQSVMVDSSTTYNIVSPDVLKLTKGIMLVQSRQPMLILSGRGKVYVSGNAIALVKKSGSGLRVSNLTDSRRDSLLVVYGNRLVSLESGAEALFTHQLPSEEEICQPSKIGRRLVASMELKGLGWVTTSDISLVGALAHEPILTALRTTPAAQLERKIIARIERTAVALQLVLARRGPYRCWQPDFAVAQGSPNQDVSTAGGVAHN